MVPRRRKPSSTCTSAGRVTARLLLSFLAIAASPAAASIRNPKRAQAVLDVSPILSPSIPEGPQPAEHTFTLRHIFHHGTYRHPGLHRRRDIVKPEAEIWLAEEDEYAAERIGPLKAKSRSRKIERLVDRRPQVVDPMVAEARQRGYVLAGMPSAWTIDDVPGPDISDKETVLSMAYVASNAYVQSPDLPDWDEVGEPFNRSADFGWEGDGLRGHIWADETNSTVIIGLKGTSPAVFDGEGTTTNDKVNDNLFFSCCCAQQGQWSWHQVCDCATGTYSCNNTCVTRALREENRYYQAARELYSNVTEIYPDANIWTVGHSLGGAVSSLLGLTYGLPTVTFEAVPEALAAGRLGLPVPPHADARYPQTREYTGAYHVGHTADPVYIGTCNGATASCSFAGYAMESACHTGMECAYDTVGDKGWRVGIGTHKIRSVIADVIKKYDTAPNCTFTPECRDCANWKMYESNSTDGTTSSSSSSTTTKTRTRTETCKTPGWWGCLDETTTTTGTATSTSTTTTSTSTCKTPGWFGCRDETTTNPASSHFSSMPPVTSTTAPPSTSPSTMPTTSTTTCKTPGWFGKCNDEITSTIATATTTSTVSTTCNTPGWFGCNDPTTSHGSSTTTTTCETPGWFGLGCNDETTSTIPTHPITSAPSMPTTTINDAPEPTEPPQKKAHCLHRNWFGFCKEWADGDRTWGGYDEI